MGRGSETHGGREGAWGSFCRLCHPAALPLTQPPLGCHSSALALWGHCKAPAPEIRRPGRSPLVVKSLPVGMASAGPRSLACPLRAGSDGRSRSVAEAPESDPADHPHLTPPRHRLPVPPLCLDPDPCGGRVGTRASGPGVLRRLQASPGYSCSISSACPPNGEPHTPPLTP